MPAGERPGEPLRILKERRIGPGAADDAVGEKLLEGRLVRSRLRLTGEHRADRLRLRGRPRGEPQAFLS